jgi:hypothetical protein
MSLKHLINLLQIQQVSFVPFYPSKNEPPMLPKSCVNSFDKVVADWKSKHEDRIGKINISISVNDMNINSLYDSLLLLLHPTYRYSSDKQQKLDKINIFTRFLIAQVELNSNLNSNLNSELKHKFKLNKVKSNVVIETIKDTTNHQPHLIKYLTWILCVNIVVLSKNNLSIYHCDDLHYECAPYVVMYWDSDKNEYNSIIYGDSHPQLFTNKCAFITSLKDLYVS